MACRILRAPVLAQNICKSAPNLHFGSLSSLCIKSNRARNADLFQKRAYQNYKCSGELAALKDLPDGTEFVEEPEYPEVGFLFFRFFFFVLIESE